jgi:H-type small acid-soluble spore protein
VKMERATEIINSHGVIDVQYRGAQVWLEKFDGDRAEISYLESGRRAVVPVSELSE